MPAIQRITPCLWFDDQAEEAAKFSGDIAFLALYQSRTLGNCRVSSLHSCGNVVNNPAV